MSLADKPLDEITEPDLEELLSRGVQEGLRIEYKRELYGNADADKKEFLKDVTALANSQGGHLLIGIEEDKGVPTAIVPFSADADAEVLRLDGIARDAVEPRILGVHMRAVPVSGGNVIVIRVPRSWGGPHRVVYKGSSRFYGRTSAGAFELGIEELRAMFSASITAMDRARAFRERRLSLISSDEGIVPLARADGRLIMHIYPLHSLSETAIDLQRAQSLDQYFSPLGGTGWSPEINFDGFANIRSGTEVFGYTHLFRSGAVEATKVRIVAENKGVRRIPALDLGGPIIKAVPSYLTALEILGVQPPFAIMITLSGVRGAYLGYSQDQWLEDPAIIRRDTLELPIVLVEEFADEKAYHRALRPAFDAIWNAGGKPVCTYFSEDGLWQPHN